MSTVQLAAARFTAVPLGMLATMFLLFVMASLIQTDFELEAPPDVPIIENIVMPEMKIPSPVPKDLERPVEPPTPPEVLFEPPLTSNTEPVIPTAPTMTNFAQNNTGLDISTPQDLLPIVKVAPQYPRRAATQGLEGEVVVSFTVTSTGSTRDVQVISATKFDGTPTTVFNRAAIAAAEKFKYKPKEVNGTPTEVHNVQNRFIFELAQ